MSIRAYYKISSDDVQYAHGRDIYPSGTNLLINLSWPIAPTHSLKKLSQVPITFMHLVIICTHAL